MNSTSPDLASYIIFYVIVFVIFVIPAYVIYWKLFTKAGQAGWKYIVPFYGQYIMGVIAERPNVGITAAGSLALYYVASVLKIQVLTIGLSAVYAIFGLACLSLFIRKYDAGIGKWILFIFFPYIGVFFVNSVKYKGATTPPQNPTAPTTPTVAPTSATPTVTPPTPPAQPVNPAPQTPAAPAPGANENTPPQPPTPGASL